MWDDNFGGDGGFAGQRGDDGYYDGVYVSARIKGGPGKHRVRRLSKDYIDSHKDVMYYEPPAPGGFAGYVTTGDVNVVNMGSGVAIGRVPGTSGEEVARSTFKFYYKQTDISSTNPRTSLHDIKIGPVSSEGYKFKPEVNIFTTGRSTAWSGAGGVSPNPTPWPNLTLYPMAELDKGYVFKITLPDEYDARLHDVKFVGDTGTSLNGKVVTVKVPGDFRIITSGGGGYITYDADSMLTISLVHK